MAFSVATPMATGALAADATVSLGAGRTRQLGGAPSLVPLPVGSSPFSLDTVGLTWRGGARPAKPMRMQTVKAVVKSVDISKVVPQGDRVLVRLDEVPNTSAGGVLLPKSAAKFERYLIGEVLAIGSEVTSTGKGQKVVVSDLNAYEVNLGVPEKLCFCKEKDLLAVVE